MITPEQRARIRRLFFAEHWKVGTIAAELGIHHETVKLAVLADRRAQAPRVVPSRLDLYKDFVRATVEQHPRLRATRLHEMIRARGYDGSVVQLRRYLQRARPATQTEAYLRL